MSSAIPQPSSISGTNAQEPLRVLCALNPVAGTGIALRRWPKIAALMDALRIEPELLAGQETPLTEQVLAHLRQGDIRRYAAIVGVGGDGTHSCLINALMAYRRAHPQPLPPYVLIPMGTGNDIAKSFNIDAREDLFVSDLRRAVAAIRYGADYMLDLGRFRGRYFVDALTIGLDSSILREHNRRKAEIARFPLLREIVKGQLLYTWCAGLRFWRQRLMPVEIAIDGRPWYAGSVLNVLINNTRVYGGEFAIAPDAYANDGLLDVVVFTGRTDYLRKYLLTYRNNPWQVQKVAQRLSQVASYVQGRRVEIALTRPETAQCDGEELPADSRFEVTVEPRAFHIKLPAEPG